MDVAQTDFLEEVVDGTAPGERVMVDPRQQRLEHLFLFCTEAVIFQVTHELWKRQLTKILSGGHIRETPHRHLLRTLLQTFAVKDLRQPDHAETVLRAQLLLKEHGASLEEIPIVKHGCCLHEWEHYLHGDADAARVNVVHNSRQHIRGDSLKINASLAALHEVAAEHSAKVRAAGHQNAPVTGELLVLAAEQDVRQDALLPEGVELAQKVAGMFRVFEGENLLWCDSHPAMNITFFSEKM